MANTNKFTDVFPLKMTKFFQESCNSVFDKIMVVPKYILKETNLSKDRLNFASTNNLMGNFFWGGKLIGKFHVHKTLVV